MGPLTVSFYVPLSKGTQMWQTAIIEIFGPD
jgi:hypothetical protein